MPTEDRRLVRLFLGIFCRPNQYAHRALMRATMLSFAPSAPGAFDHRFVVCGAARSTRAAVANEDDILILNVSNLLPGRGFCGKNRGSVELLVAVASLWPARYDWIAKTDFDAFVVLPNLVRALAPLPRRDGYFGIHCISGKRRDGKQLLRAYAVDDDASHTELFWDDSKEVHPSWFMCGMLYAVTADVASWLGSPGAKPRRKMPGIAGEDYLLRHWLHAGGRGSNARSCLWTHCGTLYRTNLV